MEIQGTATSRLGWWVWLEQHGVPPYPGGSLVPSLVIPSAPMLPKGLGDAALFEQVSHAYRQATGAATGKPCWLYKRGSQTKVRKLFVLAGRIMQEKSVAPLSWVYWSTQGWLKKSPKATAAPAAFVFSPKRLKQQRWRFRQEDTFATPSSVLVPSHRKLLKLYMEMRRELGKLSREEDLDTVAATVDHYFGSGMFDTLVEAAQNDVEEAQHNITLNLRNGNWIWDTNFTLPSKRQ